MLPYNPKLDNGLVMSPLEEKQKSTGWILQALIRNKLLDLKVKIILKLQNKYGNIIVNLLQREQ